MAIRIKIYALDHEDAEPRWIGPVRADDGASYSSLRERLESVGILPWKFQFWDIEDSCRINVKLESLNSILPVVHVIPAEGEGGAGFKRQRIERDDIESVGGLPSNSAELEGTTDPVERSATVIPASTSRVTGSSPVEAPLVVPEIWLQSTLISAEIMDKYILEEENLRRKLKGISLEDHDWKLKSFDHNGVGVVKIYCLKCNKHHGGISRDHTSHAIQNLFNNFKGSHLGSTAHDRNLPSSTGKKGASESGIQIYLNYYSWGPGWLKFRYDLSDSNWVDVESIISSVALTYNSDTKMYSLDSEDASSFDTFVSNKN